MAGRRPARMLAPLALIAVVVATFLVVSSSLRDDGGDSAAQDATATQTQGRTTTTAGQDAPPRRKRKQPTTYTVQPGDILSTVSEQTGVSVEEIQALNPDVDPQALQVGQELQLSPDAETDDTP